MNVCKPLPKTLTDCWEWYKTAQDQLTEFIQQTVTQMFADDPSLLYPKGVTDGSAAAPGMPGEVISATVSGTWSGGGTSLAAPVANFVVVPVPLPAGDWNVEWKLTIPSVSGLQGAMLRLAPAPPGALNDMSMVAVFIASLLAPGSGNQAFLMACPATPINLATATGMVFNLYVWTPSGPTNGTYTFEFWARRVR